MPLADASGVHSLGQSGKPKPPRNRQQGGPRAMRPPPRIGKGNAPASTPFVPYVGQPARRLGLGLTRSGSKAIRQFREFSFSN
jgi:hypothetical protein